MFRCAMVVLPDAFLASVGAMADSCSLIFDRFRHIVVEPDKTAPAMTLTVLSLDGASVRIGGGVDYSVDRAFDTDGGFDFIWMPSFRIGEIG